jgi:NitT/TauT family transport system ATP-binding protein
MMNAGAEEVVRKSTAILQFRELSFTWERPVPGSTIGNLELDILDDEVLCVAGPPGCGRTTLFRILAGLETPASGLIAVNGRAAGWGVPSRGFTFAENSLFPWLTVRQNVSLPHHLGGFRATDPWRVDALLGMVGLLEVARRLPRELAPPTRRLAELCRALVRDPILVLLDEPFHGLDFDDRQVLADQLERVRGVCRKTFVLFTEDIAMAVQLADRVAIMSGRPAHITEAVPVPLRRPRRSCPPGEQADIVQHLLGLYESEPRTWAA